MASDEALLFAEVVRITCHGRTKAKGKGSRRMTQCMLHVRWLRELSITLGERVERDTMGRGGMVGRVCRRMELVERSGGVLGLPSVNIWKERHHAISPSVAACQALRRVWDLGLGAAVFLCG